MYRNVEINIPMFVGIILLVAAISALLIWGVDIFTNNMETTKQEFNSEMLEINQYFETTPQNTIGNSIFNQINW